MGDTNERTNCYGPQGDSGSITPGLIFGLAIIGVGLLFLLDNFGVNVGFLWRYWPVILIAIGIAKIVDAPDPRGRTGGAIIALVGLVLIADEIHLPFLNNISLWSLWPLGLIVFGAMLLWQQLEGKSVMATPFGGGSPDNVNIFSIFGGGNRKVSGVFRGADMVAIFGGGGLDVRGATMEADQATVNANAMFGGFEIRVPETWQVQMQVTSIFGGCDDKTHQPDPRLTPNPKKLIVRGATIFGGLSVKN